MSDLQREARSDSRHSQSLLWAAQQSSANDFHDLLQLQRPLGREAAEDRIEQARGPIQLADFKNEGQYNEPTIRKDFKDTTFWQPDIVTGADGKATVDVKLPDNLTTWRATVRGVTFRHARRFSAPEVRREEKNLILRLETPRFMTEGDTVTLSAIVHNYLDSAKAVQISIDVTGAKLLGTGTQTVNIAKQASTEIDWRVSANQVGGGEAACESADRSGVGRD